MPCQFTTNAFNRLPGIKPPKDKLLLGGFHIGTFWQPHFIRWSHDAVAKNGVVPKATIGTASKIIPNILLLLIIPNFPILIW